MLAHVPDRTDPGRPRHPCRARLASIPERFTKHARRIAIVVEEMADDDTLDAMGMESGYDLTGLYRGTPMHWPASPSRRATRT